LLERKGSGLLFLLFLPIPLLFVFIGAVGFSIVAFRVKLKPRVRPVNPNAGRRLGAVLMVVVGLGLFLAFALGPLRHAIAARSWRAEECRIVRSEVRRYSTGSDRFSPMILYSYTVNGEERRSDAYSLFEYSAGGWAAARRMGGGAEDGRRRGGSPAVTGLARPSLVM